MGYLEMKRECPMEMVKRLRGEGCRMGEVEYALRELNKIRGVYDSLETALKILEY